MRFKRFCSLSIAAAIGMSILAGTAAAKENDLDPYRYLVWLLHNAPGLSRTDEAWAESFLPVNAPQKCKIPKP